jgi:hypothetical protein
MSQQNLPFAMPLRFRDEGLPLMPRLFESINVASMRTQLPLPRLRNHIIHQLFK